MSARATYSAPFPFPLRARMAYSGPISCPNCGEIFRYRIDAGRTRFQCLNRACRHDWQIGIVLRSLLKHPCPPSHEPLDSVLPLQDIAEPAYPFEPINSVI